MLKLDVLQWIKEIIKNKFSFMELRNITVMSYKNKN